MSLSGHYVLSYLKMVEETCPFQLKNNEVWEKYEEIWDVIRNKLGIKFHHL